MAAAGHPEGEAIVHGEWAPTVANTATGGRFAEEYAGGWLVAQGASATRDAATFWLIVKDDPARLATDVLPLLGIRHDLPEGSIRLLDTPEQVPATSRWIDEWVKNQRSRDGLPEQG